MAENVTLARPYAEAVFTLARERGSLAVCNLRENKLNLFDVMVGFQPAFYGRDRRFPAIEVNLNQEIFLLG